MLDDDRDDCNYDDIYMYPPLLIFLFYSLIFMI